MSPRQTWPKVAADLARRLERHASCPTHDMAQAGATSGCERCRDRAALERFLRHYEATRGEPFPFDAGARRPGAMPEWDQQLSGLQVPTARPGHRREEPPDQPQLTFDNAAGNWLA